jgi:adenylate cyclase
MTLTRGIARNAARRAHPRVPAGPSDAGIANRKLVTIVHIDIVGYTRLIAADDVGTLARIRLLRGEIIEPEMALRGGQLVQTAGDSLLLTFESILGAVEFAIETQRRIDTMNKTWRPSDPLNVRVGIEISDTIADQTDLHGDGVVIAVRLQAACPPGGLCISRTIHDHVEGRVGLRFRALGPLVLKNVNRSVEAFCLRADDLVEGQRSPAAVAGGILGADRLAPEIGHVPSNVRPAVPPRNSIAVVPFVSVGDDATQEYFADGVVDDIITELSHFRNLFVIARSSSFSYKRRDVDVREIARDLGVDYVVEGSIRRANDRVRISPRLAYAQTGGQIWAEKFDGPLTDIFALQDAITQRIVAAVEPRIQAVERDRARRKPTESLDAYDYYLRAMPFCEGLSESAYATAMQLLATSMRLDPAFAPATAAAAACHLGRHDQGWSTPDIDDKREGLKLAHAALRSGADDATVLCLAGHTIAGLAADYAGGAELLDRAVELNPNYAQAWMRSGMVRVYLDDPETAIRHSDRALALSPRDSRLYIPLCAKGYAFLLLNDYSAAAQAATRALASGVKPEMAHRILITALWQLGRTDEARAAAGVLQEQIPSFRISAWRARVGFTRQKRFDMMEEALRHAKLPD